MLTLRVEIEDWREKIHQYIENNEELYSDDQLAMLLREETLNRLDALDIDYQRARQQSRGAFVILQRCDTREESEAFDKCLEEAIDVIEKLVPTSV